MNKIFKYLIGIGAIFTIGINLCNAIDYYQGSRTTLGTCNTTVRTLNESGYVCFYQETNQHLYVSIDNGTSYQDIGRYGMYCANANSFKYYCNMNYDNYMYYWNLGNYISNCPTCETCEICEEQYTSLECQEEYNLIPLSSVTASYCELNFNLIDPSSCPINEGTGIVNWSSLFINNTQYAGNDNIEIFIPDFIGWSIIYNSGTNYIDIEGYNADEDYINTIIDNTKVTPTPEDATTLAQGLTEFIPYIFISMIVLYTLYLIRKLFKS